MNLNAQEIKRNYDLLVNTLTMMCPNLDIVSDDELKDILEELEGDYYTFLYHENIIQMFENRLLKDFHVQEIKRLRNIISSIQANLWNVNAFKAEKQWEEARVLSKHILSTLK